MGVIDEYIKSGGTYGAAKRDFENEIKKALADKNHFLCEWIATYQKRHNKKADKIILSIMMGALRDNTHPLHWCAFWFMWMLVGVILSPMLMAIPLRPSGYAREVGMVIILRRHLTYAMRSITPSRQCRR